MTDLSGKVALVTGGSGGIGAAICHRLADEGVEPRLPVFRKPHPKGSRYFKTPTVLVTR